VILGRVSDAVNPKSSRDEFNQASQFALFAVEICTGDISLTLIPFSPPLSVSPIMILYPNYTTAERLNQY
jgi:hypothetical protein